MLVQELPDMPIHLVLKQRYPRCGKAVRLEDVLEITDAVRQEDRPLPLASGPLPEVRHPTTHFKRWVDGCIEDAGKLLALGGLLRIVKERRLVR